MGKSFNLSIELGINTQNTTLCLTEQYILVFVTCLESLNLNSTCGQKLKMGSPSIEKYISRIFPNHPDLIQDNKHNLLPVSVAHADLSTILNVLQF